MNKRLIVIDFEVLSNANFWMCCMKDVKSGLEHTIVNDRNEFLRVFNKNRNNIWLGYNIRGYDQWIMKALLANLNPCMVSDKIIKEKLSGWQIDRSLNSQELFFFELGDGFKSLKELELFMGESIVESSVPFDLKTYPSKEEIEELTSYCLHDVRMTLKVFNELKHEYEAQEALINYFNLEESFFNKSKAQLSSSILGAKRPNFERNDEFDFNIIDTLEFSKYDFVKKWYEDFNNRDYKKGLKINVYNVETDFGWGGLHSARKKYNKEGFIVNSDVSSFYPSIIINYNLLSRNVSKPEKYKQIRDTRIELKKNKDPKEYPLKIVLNSVFGASKDRNNDLYDPQVGNAICVNGQLLLLDLIEKVELEFEDNAEFIQGNTDGVMFRFNSKEDVDKYLKICEDWCSRTKMDLDHDMIEKVIQKDVNNYIFIQKDKKVKSKGAYVKKLSLLDNDLPIVNKALKEYLINNVSIEDTILNCNSLIDFQKCVKITGTYKYALYGQEKINLKVIRVFASKLARDPSIMKVKEGFKNPEKIGNTPDRVFIVNDNIIDMKIPSKLDKSWYINLAKKRLEDFAPEPEITLFDLLN
ncbi:DNA polymerase domain-containing protein [Clostridium sp. CCUG 7971]|uniref:DNA polymerase domain-containing protein n=1 Tax=Clostridium sp. CCUG 7971 TaxID=2811414 RepID=UPI0025703080|nr:DNA polymerase domain-containing protein [Clostridium sp. CCUG 7971]